MSYLYLKKSTTYLMLMVLLPVIIVLTMLVVPAFLIPADEAERLQSLYHYDVLYSPQEELFEEMVALAATLFRLPIAYISLVDAEQVHYKASYGLAQLPPQPRADLLCAHVIKRGHLVVHQDLAAASQTASDAQAIRACLNYQLRFYAGAPLRMPDHHIIGTLCLGGTEPREFSATEQALLEAIAGLTSQIIAARYYYRSTPALGNAQWQTRQAQARDEVYGLSALVRYLAARYGTSTPVPEEILQPVWRRMADLRAIVEE
ncbi:MAG: GAF domain-containing protein [Hymenobacter sp.]|nr:MAG: GAF domain-containing protein [Hymenobacter sp.]